MFNRPLMLVIAVLFLLTDQGVAETGKEPMLVTAESMATLDTYHVRLGSVAISQDGKATGVVPCKGMNMVCNGYYFGSDDARAVDICNEKANGSTCVLYLSTGGPNEEQIGIRPKRLYPGEEGRYGDIVRKSIADYKSGASQNFRKNEDRTKVDLEKEVSENAGYYLSTGQVIYSSTLPQGTFEIIDGAANRVLGGALVMDNGGMTGRAVVASGQGVACGFYYGSLYDEPEDARWAIRCENGGEAGGSLAIDPSSGTVVGNGGGSLGEGLSVKIAGLEKYSPDVLLGAFPRKVQVEWGGMPKALKGVARISIWHEAIYLSEFLVGPDGTEGEAACIGALRANERDPYSRNSVPQKHWRLSCVDGTRAEGEFNISGNAGIRGEGVDMLGQPVSLTIMPLLAAAVGGETEDNAKSP